MLKQECNILYIWYMLQNHMQRLENFMSLTVITFIRVTILRVIQTKYTKFILSCGTNVYKSTRMDRYAQLQKSQSIKALFIIVQWNNFDIFLVLHNIPCCPDMSVLSCSAFYTELHYSVKYKET